MSKWMNEWYRNEQTDGYPNIQLHVFECHRLDVETDGRDCAHTLAELQFVQNGCLACCVEAEHKKTQLLVAEQL